MAPTRSGPKEAAKRRGRPPGKRNEITARKGGPTEHSLTATKKRGATSAAAKGKEKQKKQGEKRKSQAEDNESSSHPKPRGRPPKDRTEAPVATQEKGKKRKSQAGENNRPSKQAKQQGRPPKDRNQEPVEDPDELAAEQPKTQTYVQLVPRTRRIPQEKIDTWPQVSAQVLEEIVAVLRDAKKDIVNTARDDRRELADERLGALVRTLEHQLADSRIPPQARDIHFDIDKLTERTAQVFREVTTQRHSKQLLTDQVKVAERLLAKDEENLEQLKKNTAKWRAAWKRQEQRGQLHPLLQSLDHGDSPDDGPDDIGLKRSRPADVSMLDTPDDELASLLEQLRRSLESMQGNHEQVAGINEAMSKAQAALDDVLFRHASARQYAAL